MEKDIGKIRKNDQSDILIRIDDFGGNRGLTIREFVTSEKYTGFTKAGVRIIATEFPKFKEMINSISEAEMRETPSDSEEKPEPKQKTLNSAKKKPSEELPDY